MILVPAQICHTMPVHIKFYKKARGAKQAAKAHKLCDELRKREAHLSPTSDPEDGSFSEKAAGIPKHTRVPYFAILPFCGYFKFFAIFVIVAAAFPFSANLG